jgi:uncharacterized lipoprotein YajG
MIRNIAVLSSLALLMGCAFTPQKAALAPTVNVMQSSEGQGTTVAVRVVDERPSKSLGRRGTAYGAAAEITSEQDVATVVYAQIADGLKKKGFTVVDYKTDADPTLSIELRLLEYSTSQGFWTGGVQVQGAMKAVAKRKGKEYEQMYRIDNKERVVVVPTAKTNEGWINAALGEIIGQLFNDKGLFGFLAG